MRVKWWVGLVTIAVAAPFGARADVQATRVPDLWDSWRVEGAPVFTRVPMPLASQSDPAAAVAGEPAAIRAVDTYMPRRAEPRRSEGSATPGNGGNAGSRGVPTTTPHLAAAAAAPEMNAGLAAAGLTLLFGCVAILRGRRLHADA